MTQKRWRERYGVHPAAEDLPMMSDDELRELGEDIKRNGLRNPIGLKRVLKRWVVWDGRNRLEAMERAGIEVDAAKHFKRLVKETKPVDYILSQNIRRRHLSAAQVAGVLVRLAKREVGQGDPVYSPKGGRGKKNPIKQRALEMNGELPREHRVSDKTIKRAIARAAGVKPVSTRARPSAAAVQSAVKIIARASWFGTVDATHISMVLPDVESAIKKLTGWAMELRARRPL